MSTPLTLLAVHAHPDDEVFSTGGVLAQSAAQGLRTVLICATGGEVGEIHDPDLNEEEARPRLGSIREAELRRACAILQIGDLYMLGYHDSGMVGTPENERSDNLHNTPLAEVTGRIVKVIRETQPQVVVTYDARGGYGHPDHIAVHRATMAAVEAAGDATCYPEQGLAPWSVAKLYYAALPLSALQRMGEELKARGIPVPFGEEFDPSSMSVPDELITTTVDVRDQIQRKREALRAHRTQIPASHFMLTMPEELATQAFGYETFTRVMSTVETALPENDLFAGLR